MTALVGTSDHSAFIEKKGREWKKIDSAPRDGTVIDVWLTIHSSPMSIGMGDSFGVPDAWFKDGNWVHMYRGRPEELQQRYITHWRPKGPFRWAAVNGDGHEYLIGKGRFGDEFVEDDSGACVRRRRQHSAESAST